MPEQVARKLDLKQICYIDDSKTSAYVTKKLLKQHGFMVDHFADAESALEALMEHDYVLLITDLMISAEGGVNGDDLIRLIRQSGHPVKSRIPIVVVTGSSDLATHDNLLHVGADRVLHKPLNGKTLQSTIEDLAPQLTAAGTTQKTTEGVAKRPVAKAESPKQKVMKPAKIEIRISDELKNLEEVTAPELIATKPVRQQENRVESSKFVGESIQYLKADELVAPVSIQKPEVDVEKVDTFIQLEVDDEIATPVAKKDVPAIPTLTEVYGEEITVPEKKSKLTPAEALLEAARTEETISQLLEAMAEGKEEIERPVIYKEQSSMGSKPAAREDITVKKQQLSETAEKSKAPETIAPENITLESISTPRQESPVKREEVPVKREQPFARAENKIAKPNNDSEKDNPLLSLLDHLDDQKVEYDREQPFKSKSIFSSSWFKKTFWAVLLIGLIAPAVTFWVLGQKQIVVQTIEVSRGLLSTEISVPGRVVSKRKINVSARMGGQITELPVREGDTVSKGQLLVQMDDKEALSEINRTQVQLLSIQETVSQTSKLQERLQKALDLGAVSRQRVEDAEAEWKAASARQSVIEEELKAAKLQLDKLKIKAPFDGMITSVTAQEGQWVAPSTPLLNIVDMSQRMAEINVDVSDSGNLSIGQVVTLTSDAFPGQNWEEQITKISSEASREDTANIIKVYASLDKSPADLRIGQQLDAQIRTAARSHTLMIPFNVMFNHQNRPHVAVIENSKVRFVPVVLGIESVTHVEVIDGLREGQQLIVPTGVPLQEGDSVVVAGDMNQQ